jgi:hypothetical protein
MSSYQDHRIGQTIYADDIKLFRVKRGRTPRESVYNANLHLVHKDYSGIVSQLETISSDNIITPTEKKTISREWTNLNSVRSTILQKTTKYNIDQTDIYADYMTAYDNLNSMVSYVLDPLALDEDTDVSAHPPLSELFNTYYESSKLLNEEIFQYESRMNDGFDYRVSLQLQIEASKAQVPDDGTPSKLSIVLLQEGEDVTAEYDVSCFTWYRMSEDSAADEQWNLDHATASKTLDVTVDDLVSGYANFICRFYYLYSETMYIGKNAFISMAKEIPGPKGEDAYQLQVISHNGTTFRMKDGFSTTMEARVWQGGVDITDEFTDADFRWRRTSNDPYADTVWNSAHYSTGGKTITITQDDVVGRSNFFCDLLRERS